MKNLKLDFFKDDYSKYIDLLLEYATKIVLALALLLIGLWVISKIVKFAKRLMVKSKIDTTLQNFLSDLLSWGLKILLIISVLGQLGVQTTSFIAVLGAAGLAVGLSLQGALSNFAGGTLIMLFKPFKLGDLIEAQGEIGTVKEIQIFVTKILTPDNKVVIIPNGPLSNGIIKNFTEDGKIRVDLTIGISYNADIKKVKDIILKTMVGLPSVRKEPAPSVNVSELADSSVNLAVRPWATPANYWDAYFGTLEACKEALDKEGIEIPFPQRDIHLFEHKN